MSRKTIFSRPLTKTLWNASHRSLVGTDTWPNLQLVLKGFVSRLKSKPTAATQQQNSELSQQVNELQDQLQAERANTQERINLERAEREQLEEMLKEERVERERLLEEERTSRLDFEKNMMAKFVELSQQMGTQQVITVIRF